MQAFFDWLTKNPSVTNILLISIVILLASIVFTLIVIVIIAIIQGRSVSFWPPTIGEKPRQLKDKDTNDNKGNQSVNDDKEFASKHKQAEKQVNSVESKENVDASQANQPTFYNYLAPFQFMEQMRIEDIRSIKILCFTGRLLLAPIEEKIDEFLRLKQTKSENLDIAIYVAIKHPVSESLRRASQIEETLNSIKRLKENENVNIQYNFYQSLPSHRGVICEDHHKNRTAYLSSYEWLSQKNQASRYAIVIKDSPQSRSSMIDMLESWISHYRGRNNGRIHTIIFDFDDTLAPTMKIQIKAWVEALNIALNKGDITLEDFAPELRDAKNDPRTYYDCIQDKFVQYQMADKIIMALLPGLKDEHIKGVINAERFRIRQELIEDVDLFKGVENKLLSLREQYHLAIVTATSSKLVRKFLKKKGIDDCFTLILGKDDPQYRWDKVEDKASLLLEVSGQMGIPLDRFVYIGDNTSDYIASKQVSVRFIEAAQTAKMLRRDSLIQSDDAIKSDYRFESFDNDNTLDRILAKINDEENYIKS